MVSSTIVEGGSSSSEDPARHSHYSERTSTMTQETPESQENVESEEAAKGVTPCHPMGIKPSGNCYVNKRINTKDAAGLLSYLPDELLLQILEFAQPSSLLRLGATCKSLWAFSRFEDLWRTQSVKNPQSSKEWKGSWFRTVLKYPSRQPRADLLCENLFSDVLYRPFLCLSTPLSRFVKGIPIQNKIPRLEALGGSDFASAWVNRPFILANNIQDWPLCKWSWHSFGELFGDVTFAAEAMDWTLESYLDYAGNNQDESPLYLFDHSFAEKMGLRVGKHSGEGDYWVPECFGEDFFSVLGNQRPDHRWLIVGPERSGSTFHKDPNATSAWNAVIRGLKYWIMFPTAPDFPPPPGVFVSPDQSEVTSPVSLTEWLLGFHAEARNTKGCLEGLCREGEVVHVPSGWWHLVINIEPSIAITQNFVPRGHLVNALDFLKNKADQISGFKSDVHDPYETFVARLQEEYPEALAEAMIEMGRLHGKKRKWDNLANHNANRRDEKQLKHNYMAEKGASSTQTTDDNQKDQAQAADSRFSFGFGNGDASDEEIP